MKKTTAPKSAPMRRGFLVALLGLSLAESALAIYQWIELVILRHGGKTSCSINETINCAVVWNSPAAILIHRATGLPAAGLGLVWGIAATVVGVLLLRRFRQGLDVDAQVSAVRLVAIIGLLAVAVFASGSALAHALCITCLGTYTLVVAFAGIAFFGLRGPVLPPAYSRADVLLSMVLPAFGAYLLLLYPGLQTPSEPAAGAALLEKLEDGPVTHEPPQNQLEAYLDSLPIEQKQALSDALFMYKNSPPQQTDGSYGTRPHYGPQDAPVRIVEFTDIRCPHCKHFTEAMTVLKRVVPSGSISIESRQFPLSAECNPDLPPDPTGTRCLAARALICLEGSADYWHVQEQLFAEQESLTPERVLDVASSGSVKRDQLVACLARPETNDKLKADLAYARATSLEGTPWVLVNGRIARAFPPLLYALAMTNGNPDAPAFRRLPPPKLAQ